MKNPKTSIAGILTLLVTGAHMIWPAIVTSDMVIHVSAILSGFGLWAANDAKKSLND